MPYTCKIGHALSTVYCQDHCSMCRRYSSISTMFRCSGCNDHPLICNGCAAAIHAVLKVTQQDGFTNINEFELDKYGVDTQQLIEQV